jgi:hypothetical protein
METRDFTGKVRTVCTTVIIPKAYASEEKLSKACAFAYRLYKKAIKERDKKGYRENLGYDSANKLTDYVSTLDMHYQDQCKAKSYFNQLMDTV